MAYNSGKRIHLGSVEFHLYTVPTNESRDYEQGTFLLWGCVTLTFEIQKRLVIATIQLLATFCKILIASLQSDLFKIEVLLVKYFKMNRSQK